MGGATFVKVKDADWRFDPEAVFDALRHSFAGRTFWQGNDERQLEMEGFADGWDVNLNREMTAFIIKAPPAPMIELVAWVRGYVPADVALEIFDDQLSVDVAQLQPGLSADQVRAQFFPEAWKIEQMSPTEPPTLEERMRPGPPPHIAELMDREKPPQTGPDRSRSQFGQTGRAGPDTPRALVQHHCARLGRAMPSDPATTFRC